jgi:hypothetical protein
MNGQLLREMHQIVNGTLFGHEDRPPFEIPPAARPRVDPGWTDALDLAQRAIGQAERGMEALDVEMAVGGGKGLAEAPVDSPHGQTLRAKYARLERKAHLAKKTLREMRKLVHEMRRDVDELISAEWGGITIPWTPR